MFKLLVTSHNNVIGSIRRSVFGTRKVFPSNNLPKNISRKKTSSFDSIIPNVPLRSPHDSISTNNTHSVRKTKNSAKSQKSQTNKFKIMVVDDTKSIRKMLEITIKNNKDIQESMKDNNLELIVITVSNCADAIKKYQNNNDIRIILLDFDLDSTKDNCKNKEEFFCCKDDNPYKPYISYFDNGISSNHSKHNGVELARELYKQGYRNTFALQTSFHAGNKTIEEEQQMLDNFMLKHECKIIYVGKEYKITIPNLVPLIHEELTKMKSKNSGGRKHLRSTTFSVRKKFRQRPL